MNKPVDVDWQSTKHTPLDRAKHLLETGLNADVEFLVGSKHGKKEVLSVLPI